ncbi:MAG: ribonuclease P protein component [Actinomycetes bacterium]
MWRVRDRATFEALGRARPSSAGPIRVRRVSVGDGPPRVAYAVGRSVGDAVRRNRVRRRLRAAVREHAAELRPASAYLVGAGPEARVMTSKSLSEAVQTALRSAS